MKRRHAVYMIQALGLLCIAAGLYLGWVESLAVRAAVIRGTLTAHELASHVHAWGGLPDVVVLALRGPAVWLGMAVVIIAPWLPIPDSQGRRATLPPPEHVDRAPEPAATVAELPVASPAAPVHARVPRA